MITILLQKPYLMRAPVFWNVTLSLRLRSGLPASGLRACYRDSMAAVGFADPDSMAARTRQELSGGERQRVAQATRLVMEPAGSGHGPERVH